MTIDATAVGLTPESTVLFILRGVSVTLELTTTKGQPHRIKYKHSFDGYDGTPNYRPATLKALVELILKHRSASERYVAERNGVKVVEYRERHSWKQAMSQLVFTP